VLATVPNPRFGSGSGLEPNWNCWNGFHPIRKPNRTEPLVFWPVPKFCQLGTLAPIKYMSSDHITIWYICGWCRFACSFSSYSPLCNPINIHCITAKHVQFSALIHSNSSNIDRIAKWRIGSGWACKTASFTYISDCDTIRTQILNWSQSSDYAKMRLCCVYNPAKKLRVYVRSGWKPRQDNLGRVFGQDRNRTEQNRTAGQNPDRWRVTRTRC